MEFSTTTCGDSRRVFRPRDNGFKPPRRSFLYRSVLPAMASASMSQWCTSQTSRRRGLVTCRPASLRQAKGYTKGNVLAFDKLKIIQNTSLRRNTPCYCESRCGKKSYRQKESVHYIPSEWRICANGASGRSNRGPSQQNASQS